MPTSLPLNANTAVWRTVVAAAMLFMLYPPDSLAEQRYEGKVLSSIEELRQNRFQHSLEHAETLVSDYPNSRIGHLMLADLLAARSGKPVRLDRYPEYAEQLAGLRDELSLRWKWNRDKGQRKGLIPDNLLQAAADQKYVLVVDASKARLYVYENNSRSFSLADDFYVTIGKAGMGKRQEGDFRTPVGVYFVTGFVPGEELPDRYGPGAFPIDYPNTIDRRRSRTGYGIWLHGTEKENYNRIPLASDGCVTMSNDAFTDLSKYIDVDGTTPVIIARRYNWVTPDLARKRLDELSAVLDEWETDWESLEFARYIRHYSPDRFAAQNHDFSSWSRHKHSVNAHKRFIDIRIRDLSVFSYPGEEDMVLMLFRQDYASDNHSNSARKKLFWQKNPEGKWKIIYEE